MKLINMRTSLVCKRVSLVLGGRKPLRSVCVRVAQPKDESTTFLADVIVEEVMQPTVHILKASDPVKKAVTLFLTERISGAPVLDDEGRLVGLLSETDLIWKEVGVPESHLIVPPVYLPFLDSILQLQDDKAFREEARRILSRTVGEAMSNDVVTTAPETPLAEAARLMLHKRISRLPVVDKNGKIVGILGKADVLRALLLEHNPYLE